MLMYADYLVGQTTVTGIRMCGNYHKVKLRRLIGSSVQKYKGMHVSLTV
jgi:hypothetical protein